MPLDLTMKRNGIPAFRIGKTGVLIRESVDKSRVVREMENKRRFRNRGLEWNLHKMETQI